MKIPLHRGKRIIGYALVDKEDYVRLLGYRWGFHNGYAVRYLSDSKCVYMHREINKTPIGFLTDHKNSNRLDNRKNNLRSVTYSQNRINRVGNNASSGYRGVYWYEPRKLWQVQITLNGITKSVGYRKNKREAAKLYNEAARELFGEYACFNKV